MYVNDRPAGSLTSFVSVITAYKTFFDNSQDVLIFIAHANKKETSMGRETKIMIRRLFNYVVSTAEVK